MASADDQRVIIIGAGKLKGLLDPTVWLICDIRVGRGCGVADSPGPEKGEETRGGVKDPS